MSLLTLLTFLGLIATCANFGTQYLKAKGRLICPSAPAKAANVLVKLIDEDDGPDPDDLMAQTHTDAQGNFELQGSTFEISNIDGRLKAYHHCNTGFGARCLYPCYRRLKVIIPDSYISKSENVQKVFDLGVYNLDMYMSHEECKCTPP